MKRFRIYGVYYITNHVHFQIYLLRKNKIICGGGMNAENRVSTPYKSTEKYFLKNIKNSIDISPQLWYNNKAVRETETLARVAEPADAHV